MKAMTTTVALVVALVVVTGANAATYIWDGAASSAWDLTDANWDIDGGSSDVAWDNASAGSRNDAEIPKGSTLDLENGVTIYVHDLEPDLGSGNDSNAGNVAIRGINTANTVLRIAGDVAVTSNDSDSRVKFDQVDVILDNDSA
jgi:hypothetical protein